MRKIISIIILFVSQVVAINAQIHERSNPPMLVNDFARVFSENERQQMESQLVQFANETSTQIVVVTVNDFDEYEPWDYAVRLGEKWGVGQKDSDNGIIVLLKPKTNNSRGQVFIATGYGLEGVLPDAVVNGTVIDNEMIPHFKQNNYYAGLVSGLNVLMDITRGEYTAENYRQNVAENEGSAIPAIIFFIVFFVIFPILTVRRRRFYSPGKSLPFWLAMGMMSGRNSHSGSFGNFSSGGGSFGGFGGFGGGSFGGGGAGGSW